MQFLMVGFHSTRPMEWPLSSTMGRTLGSTRCSTMECLTIQPSQWRRFLGPIRVSKDWLLWWMLVVALVRLSKWLSLSTLTLKASTLISLMSSKKLLLIPVYYMILLAQNFKFSLRVIWEIDLSLNNFRYWACWRRYVCKCPWRWCNFHEGWWLITTENSHYKYNSLRVMNVFNIFKHCRSICLIVVTVDMPRLERRTLR